MYLIASLVNVHCANSSKCGYATAAGCTCVSLPISMPTAAETNQNVDTSLRTHLRSITVCYGQARNKSHLGPSWVQLFGVNNKSRRKGAF